MSSKSYSYYATPDRSVRVPTRLGPFGPDPYDYPTRTDYPANVQVRVLLVWAPVLVRVRTRTRNLLLPVLSSSDLALESASSFAGLGEQAE
eukprot:scaffold286697_cov14-Prasinocladus_malaysianus.AAC.1